MLKFRNLKADEIDARVAQVGDGWAQLLLYKDARVDMTILDETVGPENWQREHYECKGNLFCKVGINTDNGWVFKSDCGSESNTEKEKGEASDSFKRACVNWGIGRELYTSPAIFVNVETNQNNGKFYLKNKGDRFSVEDIEITDGKITFLIIKNKQGKQVFKYGNKTEKPAEIVEENQPKEDTAIINQSEIENILNAGKIRVKREERKNV